MTAELFARFTKRYPGGPAISAAFELPAGRFSVTGLFGPSGCGKTTVLRCLAGLEMPNEGVIRFGDQIWYDATSQVCLPPQQRDIGLLFQEYALFPHLTLGANVAYGLAGMRVDEREQRVHEILARLQLAGLESHYPRQLSGGQQQRAALARVLVRRPRLLLLDEPLSALDATLRDQLRWELRRVLAEFHIPVVLVTHDPVEAMALADQMVVMDDGRVRQSGTMEEVFSRPADLSVARIVGVETICPGTIERIEEGLAHIRVGAIEITALAPGFSGQEVNLCIRAEDVMLERQPTEASSARNRLSMRVDSLVPQGPMMRVSLTGPFSLTALITRPGCLDLKLQPGDSVTALIKAPAVHLVPRDRGA